MSTSRQRAARQLAGCGLLLGVVAGIALAPFAGPPVIAGACGMILRVPGTAGSSLIVAASSESRA